MAYGKNNMKVSTREGLYSAPLKPQFRFRRSAPGAAAVLAGIAQKNPVMSIGAFVNMIALIRGAACHYVPRSPLLTFSHGVTPPVGVKVITKYLLYGPRFHPALTPA